MVNGCIIKIVKEGFFEKLLKAFHNKLFSSVRISTEVENIIFPILFANDFILEFKG